MREKESCSKLRCRISLHVELKTRKDSLPIMLSDNTETTSRHNTCSHQRPAQNELKGSATASRNYFEAA